MNALKPGQTVRTTEGEFVVTAVGLPNSCAVCGQPVTGGHWLAIHDDAARSGQGRCGPCAGVGETDEVDKAALVQALAALLLRNEAPTFENMGQLTKPAEAAVLAGEGIETYANLTIAVDKLVTAGVSAAAAAVTNEPETADVVTESPTWLAERVTNEPATADNLERIKGIGPARARELGQLGIFTFRALAAADLDYLDTAMEVSRAVIKGWQTQARKLAGSD